MFTLASLVILAQSALFAAVWYLYYRGKIFEPFWNKGNWVLIAMYALLLTLFSRLFGGLRVGYLKRMDDIYSLALAAICSNVVIYLQITLINRWFLSLTPILIMMLVQFGVIVVWTFGSRYLFNRLYSARRMLVIYGDRKPDQLIKKMQARRDKYNISGQVHVDVGEKEICRRMKEYEAVIIWDLPSQIRNRYLKYCFAHSIRCYITPKISDVILTGAERIHLFDTPLLVARNIGLNAEQLAVKRSMDIVISLIGIVISSPIMLLCALAVKIYDRGPVFYRQERLTQNGKAFRIFKFQDYPGRKGTAQFAF